MLPSIWREVLEVTSTNHFQYHTTCSDRLAFLSIHVGSLFVQCNYPESVSMAQQMMHILAILTMLDRRSRPTVSRALAERLEAATISRRASSNTCGSTRPNDMTRAPLVGVVVVVGSCSCSCLIILIADVDVDALTLVAGRKKCACHCMSIV